MPLDPSAKRLLDLLSASSAGAKRLSASERRLAFDQLMRSASGDPRAAGSINDATIPGPSGPLRIRVYTPNEASGHSTAALLYFHGGGWVSGDLDSHLELCVRLAEASGCRVVIVDYRLAPEHRFPAALEDGIAAVEWLWAHGSRLLIDQRRLGVCGDSAGANIAAALCHLLKERGGPPLALQVLLCPILDGIGNSESRRAYSEGYLLDAATLANDLLHYCPPELDRCDPRLSPLHSADFSGLPPAHIHTAEFDPVRDEGCLYAEKLTRAGCPVVYRCHPGMIHLFYGMPEFIPGAEPIVHDVGLAIGRALNS
jgi:acetyl esterase/lipase